MEEQTRVLYCIIGTRVDKLMMYYLSLSILPYLSTTSAFWSVIRSIFLFFFLYWPSNIKIVVRLDSEIIKKIKTNSEVVR